MARCIWACVAMFIAARMPVLAEDTQDEIIQKLIARVEALEREVSQLKHAAAPGEAMTPATRVREAAKSEAQPPAKEPAAAAEPEMSRFNFRAFADVDFDRNEDHDSSKRFAMGEVDFFGTAQISPRLTLLAEAALDTGSELNVGSIPADLEWLPLHNVGLSANGAIPAGDLGLHYIVEIGSSRNYAQPGRKGFDLEDNAAINFALYSRPHSVPGLELGFSAYRDRLSPLPEVDLTRAIWTAHAVYQAHLFEFLNEGMALKFELGHEVERLQPSFIQAAMQWAFTF